MDLYDKLAADYGLTRNRVKVLCFRQAHSRPHKTPEEFERQCRRELDTQGFGKNAEPGAARPAVRQYVVSR